MRSRAPSRWTRSSISFSLKDPMLSVCVCVLGVWVCVCVCVCVRCVGVCAHVLCVLIWLYTYFCSESLTTVLYPQESSTSLWTITTPPCSMSSLDCSPTLGSVYRRADRRKVCLVVQLHCTVEASLYCWVEVAIFLVT